MDRQRFMNYLKALKQKVAENQEASLERYKVIRESAEKLDKMMNYDAISHDPELSTQSKETMSTLRSFLEKEHYRLLAEKREKDLERIVKECERRTSISPDLDEAAQGYKGTSLPSRSTKLESILCSLQNNYSDFNTLRNYLISSPENIDYAQYRKIRALAEIIFKRGYAAEAVDSGVISLDNMKDLKHRLSEYLSTTHFRHLAEKRKEEIDYVTRFYSVMERTVPDRAAVQAEIARARSYQPTRFVEPQVQEEVPVQERVEEPVKQGFFRKLYSNVSGAVSEFLRSKGEYRPATSDIVDSLYKTAKGMDPASVDPVNRAYLMMANINALPDTGYSPEDTKKMVIALNNMNRMKQDIKRDVPNYSYQIKMRRLYEIIKNHAHHLHQTPAYAT